MSEFSKTSRQQLGPSIEHVPDREHVPTDAQVHYVVHGFVARTQVEEVIDESTWPAGEPLGVPATETELIAFFRQKDPFYDQGSWEDRGACRGTYEEAFYPEGQNFGPLQKLAQRICENCPVRVECLQDALDRRDVYGIKGATRPHERRNMLKQQDSETDEVS